jgi:hypothetical protein
LYSSGNVKIYRDILEKSSGLITSKWRKQEKYIRTEFVMEAFSASYPSKVTSLSVSIDSMINILDDLLDESLSRDVKVLYILEYLRVFSLYCDKTPGSSVELQMSQYFNKLITLAIAEKTFMNQVKKENKINNIVELSKDLLLIRAHDIDIFVEIVLDFGNFIIRKENLLPVARCFRAVNILKKDILDIQHDKKQKQETLMTYLSSKKSFDFLNCLEELLNRISTEMSEHISRRVNVSLKKDNPFNGFHNMLTIDKNTVLRYVKEKKYYV